MFVEMIGLPRTGKRMTSPIHQAFQAKDILPTDHLVDTAYLDAELLVTQNLANHELWGNIG